MKKIKSLEDESFLPSIKSLMKSVSRDLVTPEKQDKSQQGRQNSKNPEHYQNHNYFRNRKSKENGNHKMRKFNAFSSTQKEKFEKHREIFHNKFLETNKEKIKVKVLNFHNTENDKINKRIKKINSYPKPYPITLPKIPKFSMGRRRGRKTPVNSYAQYKKRESYVNSDGHEGKLIEYFRKHSLSKNNKIIFKNYPSRKARLYFKGRKKKSIYSYEKHPGDEIKVEKSLLRNKMENGFQKKRMNFLLGSGLQGGSDIFLEKMVGQNTKKYKKLIVRMKKKFNS